MKIRGGPLLFGLALVATGGLAIWIFSKEAQASVAREQAATAEVKAEEAKSGAAQAIKGREASYCDCVRFPWKYADQLGAGAVSTRFAMAETSETKRAGCFGWKAITTRGKCYAGCRDVTGVPPGEIEDRVHRTTACNPTYRG